MNKTFYSLAKVVEAISFCVIIYGVFIAGLTFIKQELNRLNKTFDVADVHLIQVDFGYYILLGLELLIASDIIATALRPTTTELIELGSVIAIRIVLSYFLTKERHEQIKTFYQKKIKK